MWAAEKKELKHAADGSNKRAVKAERELDKARKALEAAEGSQRRQLERGELPPPPRDADGETVALAALNQARALP